MCSKNKFQCFWCFVASFLLFLLLIHIAIQSYFKFIYHTTPPPEVVSASDSSTKLVCPLSKQNIREYIAVYKFNTNGLYAESKELVYSTSNVDIWPNTKVTDLSSFTKLVNNNEPSILSLDKLRNDPQYSFIKYDWLALQGFDSLLIKPIIKEDKILVGILIAGVKSSEPNSNLEYLLSIPQLSIIPMLSQCKEK